MCLLRMLPFTKSERRSVMKRRDDDDGILRPRSCGHRLGGTAAAAAGATPRTRAPAGWNSPAFRRARISRESSTNSPRPSISRPTHWRARTFDVQIDMNSVDSMDKDRDGTMRGADIFDVAHFPTAHYVTRSFTKTAAGYAAMAR